MKFISLLVIGVLVIIGIFVYQFIFESTHTCIKSHKETYYDSSGTALAASTRNYGLLVLNGYKTTTVCDKWK